MNHVEWGPPAGVDKAEEEGPPTAPPCAEAGTGLEGMFRTSPAGLFTGEPSLGKVTLFLVADVMHVPYRKCRKCGEAHRSKLCFCQHSEAKGPLSWC